MTTIESTSFTQEQLVDALVYDVSSKYGAPMGRRGSTTLEPSLTYTVVKIPFFDGDYDQGGAYWGGGQPLYACISKVDGDQFIEYARHDSFESFAAYLKTQWNAQAVQGIELPCYEFGIECNECGHQWIESDYRQAPELPCRECESENTTTIPFDD